MCEEDSVEVMRQQLKNYMIDLINTLSETDIRKLKKHRPHHFKEMFCMNGNAEIKYYDDSGIIRTRIEKHVVNYENGLLGICKDADHRSEAYEIINMMSPAFISIKEVRTNSGDPKQSEIGWGDMDKDLFVRALRLHLYRAVKRIDTCLDLTWSGSERDIAECTRLHHQQVAFNDVLAWIENVEWRHKKVEWKGE